MTDDGTTDGGSGSSGGGTGSGEAGTTDYGSWDWKTILKSVTGQDPDNPDNSSTVSDPQSLQDAADTLWYVEKVLQGVAENLGSQTEALTGKNGPWQGAAAQAFNSAMTSLSHQVTTMANTLSGGITGDYNIPQELANNAQKLRQSLALLENIDSWYANEAIRIYAQENPLNPSFIIMSNGEVHVSLVPKIPPMMSSDMGKVLTDLAQKYHTTTNAIMQSNMPADPTSGNPGGVNVPPYGSPPPYSGGPFSYSLPPPYSGPQYPDPGGNIPTFNPNDPYGVNYPSGLGGGPPYGTNGPAQPVPYPKPTRLEDSSNKSPDVPAGVPSGGGLNVPVDAPPDLNSPLSAPLNLNSQSDAPPVSSPNSYPNPLDDRINGGALNPNMDTVLNPYPKGADVSETPDLTPFPNLGLGAGAKPPRGSNEKLNLSRNSPSPYSGDLNLGNGEAMGGGGLGGLDGASTYPNEGLGDLQNTTRAPLLPGSLETGVPLSDVQNYPGASSLGGTNMPMMPMGGMGRGGSGGAGSEGAPSDASGLLAGDAAPWRGPSSLADVPGEGAGGVSQGGPGLRLPHEGLPGGGTQLSASGQGGTDTPMMPMGGMGGGAGNSDRGQERSDASGLLFGSAEPWSAGMAEDGTGIGSPDGAPHHEGYLRPSGQDSMPGGLLPEHAAVRETTGPESSPLSAAEELAAGVAEGALFTRAGTSAGRSQSAEEGSADHQDGPAALAWGGPEWGQAESFPAPDLPSAPAQVQTGNEPAEDGGTAAVAPSAGEEATSPPTTQEPRVRDEAAQGVPDQGTTADDATAWDVAPDVLMPLFGGHEAGADGGGVSAEVAGEETATATGVAATVYAMAFVNADDQAPGQQARPSWQPKAPGAGRVRSTGLSCSLEESEGSTAAPSSEHESGATAATRSEAGKSDGQKRNGVAALLRQGQEVWGGGSDGAAAFG